MCHDFCYGMIRFSKDDTNEKKDVKACEVTQFKSHIISLHSKRSAPVFSTEFFSVCGAATIRTKDSNCYTLLQDYFLNIWIIVPISCVILGSSP